MQLDQATVRNPLRAGLSNNYGLIWTAGILLRIRCSVRARCDHNYDLCKQGVRGSSPLSSTRRSSRFNGTPVHV
jgi:hypothetical protein